MKKIILPLLFSQFSLFATAQEWYFGFGAGISFNGSPPSSFLAGGHTATNEGCAVANDATGHILFYTDGTTVWTRNNNVPVMLDDLNIPVTGTNGLDGNSSATQAAIIVPKPKATGCLGCQCDTFYIFTVSSHQGSMHGDFPLVNYSPNYFGYGMRYSMVVFDQAHPDGFIPSARKNISLATCVSEKLTAIYDAPNNRYWVLAHGYDLHDNNINCVPPNNNNNARQFQCFEVSAAGVNPGPANILMASSPQEATTINGQNNGDNSPGQMKFSPDGKMVALGVYDTRFVEIYDFSMGTGQLSNARRVNFPNEGKVYGVEFSPDSKQLFVGLNSFIGLNFIYQIDLFNLLLNPNLFVPVNGVPTYTYTVSPGSTFFHKLAIPSPPLPIYDYGAMQLAPDGNIYVGRNGRNYVSKITTPNALLAGFTDNAIPLPSSGAWGLPNLIVNALHSTCPIDSPKICQTCPAIANSVSLAIDNTITNPNYSLQGVHLNFTSTAPLQQVSVNLAYLSYNWNNSSCTNGNTTAMSQGCLFPATANQTIGSLIWNNTFGITLPLLANVNECAGQLQWGLGTTLQPGTYSVPMNLSLPVGSPPAGCNLVINKLCVRVSFKDANCNVCDTLIWLDTSCCSGGQWNFVQLFQTGSILTNPTSSNVQCNNHHSPIKLTCRRSYTLKASYACRANCQRPFTTYAISGPVNSSGTLPATFTPVASGNYAITYYAWCGGKICDSCTVWVTTMCRKID